MPTIKPLSHLLVFAFAITELIMWPFCFVDARVTGMSQDYARLFPHAFLRQGPPLRRIALTFDDGPDLVYTPQILRILSREHVHATFFVLGNQVELYPAMTRRIMREGHVLGNHSFDHANLVNLPMNRLVWEVTSADRELTRLTGLHSKWFRPPFGSVNTAIIRQLWRMGYHTVNWSVDSNDWRSLTASQVKANILSGVRPGAIILQHCNGNAKEILAGTVQALPDIIHALERRGYKFVTIPELFSPETKAVHAH